MMNSRMAVVRIEYRNKLAWTASVKRPKHTPYRKRAARAADDERAAAGNRYMSNLVSDSGNSESANNYSTPNPAKERNR